MFNKLRVFWNNFFFAFKEAFDRTFKEMPEEATQEYRDTKKVNFLSIFVSKLNNLVNIEATFDVESDSVLVEPIKEIGKDLEAKRFEITSEMLGEGELWVFPAHDANGKLYNRFVSKDKVRVLAMDNEKITDIIGIIDEFISSKNKVFYLNRRQTLNGDTLTIETYTTNERSERVYFDEWADLEAAYTIRGVDNVGIGRFKSPVSSRGHSTIYGVPLNFGCEEIENKIFNDLEQIENEFKNSKSLLFADPLILRKKLNTVNINGKRMTADGWEIPENLFPIETRGGNNGANIDIFSPAIRYSEFRDKLIDDMAQFEQQVGTDKGFLTPFESVSATTATEIRRANASTIALIDKIRNAFEIGIESTIKADCIFLNLSEDMYSLKIDWYDVFADPDEQFSRIKEAAKDGYAEAIDVMQWLFPNLTIDELQDKLDRIKEQKQQNLVDFNLQNINIEDTKETKEVDEE